MHNLKKIPAIIKQNSYCKQENYLIVTEKKDMQLEVDLGLKGCKSAPAKTRLGALTLPEPASLSSTMDFPFSGRSLPP